MGNQKYSSYTINIQDGKAAGQTVEHVHVHLLPRYQGDLERNDDIYADGALDCERVERTDEQMRDECAFLRQYINWSE